MVHVVVLSRRARKHLGSVPGHVAAKLLFWVNEVETHGLEETRKYRGFHDEPLRGKRRGQRSIRLSRAYRGIYEIKTDESLEFVSIEEVTKHDY